MHPRKPVLYFVDERGCHICTSHSRRNGYPQAGWNGRNTTIVRHYWEDRYGPLPSGVLLRHRCNQPACINLDHVLPGTALDNGRDKSLHYQVFGYHGTRRYEKPRQFVGKNRGSRHYNARFKAGEEKEIRQEYAQGTVSLRELAHRYGCGRMTIWRIVNEQSYG